jgi:hypothetical protein
VAPKAKRPKAKRPKRKRAGPQLILRKRLVIPWDDLTPEEQANLKGLRQKEEKFKEQAKLQAKLWPGRDPDLLAEARKALSREMRPPRLEPAPQPQSPQPQSQPQPQTPVTPEVQPQPQTPPVTPARQSQPKAKPKAKVGAERDYDRDAIRRVAKELPESGTDQHRSWFYDRVRDACKLERPVITTPANDRTMGRIIGDLYSGPKASSSQD